VRFAEVDLYACVDPELCVLAQLGPLIPVQRPAHLHWQGRYRACDGVTHCLGPMPGKRRPVLRARTISMAHIRRRGPWRNLEAVEFATLEWVDWYNNRRLLEPIGNIPPAEAEARYYAAQQEVALAA
jgi:transposase InsO family protein